MAQVKIYGLKNRLSKRRSALSDAIHEALMAAFELPEDKRFQRFIGLDEADFIHPKDRSADYTIIEISVFEGRSMESKKKLVRFLYLGALEKAGIANQDLEITIFETPRSSWGIRGMPADELTLNYRVDV